MYFCINRKQFIMLDVYLSKKKKKSQITSHVHLHQQRLYKQWDSLPFYRLLSWFIHLHFPCSSSNIKLRVTRIVNQLFTCTLINCFAPIWLSTLTGRYVRGINRSIQDCVGYCLSYPVKMRQHVVSPSKPSHIPSGDASLEPTWNKAVVLTLAARTRSVIGKELSSTGSFSLARRQ